MTQIYVTPEEGVWTVWDEKEGYLCFVPDEEQAVRVGGRLVQWFSSHGRPTELRVERSFAPPSAFGG